MTDAPAPRDDAQPRAEPPCGIAAWRQARRDESEARIVAAALKLFRRDGYRATTMLAVARDSGVSTRTLYKRFPRKADLMGALLADFAGELVEAVPAPTPGAGLVEEAVGAIAAAYAEHVSRPDLVGAFRVLIGEAEAVPELGALYREAAEARVIEPLRDWARAEVALGRPALVDVVPELGSLFGLIDHHVLWQRLLGADPARCLRAKRAARRARRPRGSRRHIGVSAHRRVLRPARPRPSR